jgi:hypothetical protein
MYIIFWLVPVRCVLSQFEILNLKDPMFFILFTLHT